MKIDIRPRKRNAPRPAWKVEKAYHQAAHTPDPLSKGIGTKAADHNAIPLCQGHHRLHTDKGWSAIGLTRETARVAAGRYWRLWSGDKGELANG